MVTPTIGRTIASAAIERGTGGSQMFQDATALQSVFCGERRGGHFAGIVQNVVATGRTARGTPVATTLVAI